MEMTTFTTNTISSPQDYSYIGKAFNEAASANILNDYYDRKTPNTKTRHDKELRNFSAFLESFGYKYADYSDLDNEGNPVMKNPGDMKTPQEWQGVTFGIIEGYQHYMLRHGYSVNTTNQTLYIIKAYAALAGKAGYIDYVELAKIKEVKGYKSGEARNIDKERKAQGAAVRLSTKKETARNLSNDQVKALKQDHPDTLRGKRDALIFALFLDMGLRESELMTLTRDSFDLDNEVLHWYREKTNNRGHETMSKDVRKAAREYFKAYTPEAGNSLFISINKWGQVTGDLSMRGLQAIVKAAGETIGIDNLSPHDLRHSMALRAYLAGIPLKSIQRRLGHSTVKTTERYIDIEALDRYNDFDREF